MCVWFSSFFRWCQSSTRCPNPERKKTHTHRIPPPSPYVPCLLNIKNIKSKAFIFFFYLKTVPCALIGEGANKNKNIYIFFLIQICLGFGFQTKKKSTVENRRTAWNLSGKKLWGNPVTPFFLSSRWKVRNGNRQQTETKEKRIKNAPRSWRSYYLVTKTKQGCSTNTSHQKTQHPHAEASKKNFFLFCFDWWGPFTLGPNSSSRDNSEPKFSFCSDWATSKQKIVKDLIKQQQHLSPICFFSS